MTAVMTDPRTISTGRKFYGKFRGTVANHIDPLGLGRIQVLVPDVSTTTISSWALPCFPWGGGTPTGGMFSVPLPGAQVWVEFEKGDPDSPIWTGCFAKTTKDIASDARTTLPPAGAVFPGLTFQTPGRHVFQISDMPGPTGGIQLRTRSGAMIAITDLGITITNGKGATITMLGKTTDINSGALTII